MNYRNADKSPPRATVAQSALHYRLKYENKEKETITGASALST
jgi:hypothetical protein